MKVLRFIWSILWDGISRVVKELLLFGALALIMGVFFGIFALGLFGSVWLGHENVPLTGILMAIWVIVFISLVTIGAGDNPYMQFKDWIKRKYSSIKTYLETKWYNAN